MRTIKEVWAINLGRLLGERNLKAVSTDSGIPYSTLRNMLGGHFAERENMSKLLAYLAEHIQIDIQEADLFVDLDRYEPKKPITPEQALQVIADALKTPLPAPKRDSAGPPAWLTGDGELMHVLARADEHMRFTVMSTLRSLFFLDPAVLPAEQFPAKADSERLQGKKLSQK